jgi:transcriptional regulator of arginine metabolism
MDLIMKNKRHRTIREIVENQNIETQLQLTQELKKYGFDVTQATISRDIKELGLIKVVSGENTFRYSLPTAVVVNSVDRSRRMFRDNVLKVIPSDNIVLVKTLPGMASAVAACLDSMNWSALLGTVAGDDTIFALTASRQRGQEVVKKLQDYVE